MAATISSINPFPNDVRDPIQHYIQDSQYIKRDRIEYSKWNQLHVFLDEPTLKPITPSESRLKHRALIEFELTHNKLYRRPDTRHLAPNYVAPESEALDIIAD
jgi:hypothetical protein